MGFELYQAPGRLQKAGGGEMTRHSARAKWNTANARAAQQLMDVFFHGFAVCQKCGEKFYPEAYQPIDICPVCLAKEALEKICTCLDPIHPGDDPNCPIHGTPPELPEADASTDTWEAQAHESGYGSGGVM
jgi:hypothetical protein